MTALTAFHIILVKRPATIHRTMSLAMRLMSITSTTKGGPR